MCGICGIAGFEDKELLKKMCRVIKHRGPDDYGFYTDKDIGLGNRRLSIIDLSTGHQPIHNENKTIWITLNGEIYNFKELRKNLENKGHRFYTNTDTEVIVHSYEEFGNDCVNLFNGMFAFALWDSNKKQLFLARDRLGIRPLYYTTINNKLLFSSEIKSILEYHEIKRKVNYESLHNFLMFRYVPGPSTLFEGIKKLPPGHILTYKKGVVNLRKYWNLKMANMYKKTENYYIKQFYKLLKNSVRMRLMSDVPVGAFLSGGIDSSSIVGIMSKICNKPVRTFSVGFGAETDEFNQAKMVSDYFGTKHHEIIVNSEDFNLLPRIIWNLDEPLGDAIIIPMYLLSKLANKHVKVVLTGEGGDELLAGYIQQKAMYFGQHYNNLVPKFIKSGLINLVSASPVKLLDKFFQYPDSLGEEGKQKLTSYLSSLGHKGKSYLSLVSLFDDSGEKLYSKKFFDHIKNLKLSEENIKRNLEDKNVKNFLNRLILQEFRSWLPDNILFKQDKIGMANSIEGRVPFLDHKLVEFVGTVPPNLKLRGLTEKYILRKSMSKLLPKQITKRSKQAFYVPIDVCFKKELDEMISSILCEENIKRRGYFRYDYIKNILQKREKSKMIYNKQLIALMILEIWHQIFIDTDKPKLNINSFY